MENPKVTYIVPNYNGEKYLTQCLNSIINQTYPNIEIIFVDDGSTDRSLEIADSLLRSCRRESQTFLVSTVHRGLSAARNRGLKLATGDFIHYFDSDDVLKLNATEEMVRTMLEKKVQIVKTSEIETHFHGLIRLYGDFNFNFDRPGDVIDLTKNPYRLITENVGIRGKLYNHKLLEGTSFPIFKTPFIPEDCITHAWALKAGKMAMGPNILSIYRRHHGSITNQKVRQTGLFFTDSAILSFNTLRQELQKNNMLEPYQDLTDAMEVMYRVMDMESIFHNRQYSEAEKNEVYMMLQTMLLQKFPNYNEMLAYQKDSPLDRTLALKSLAVLIRSQYKRTCKYALPISEGEAYTRAYQVLTSKMTGDIPEPILNKDTTSKQLLLTPTRK